MIIPLSPCSLLVAAAVASFVSAQDPPTAPTEGLEAAVYHAAGISTPIPGRDIQFTQPDASTVWYARSDVTINWTGTKPTSFAWQLINVDPNVRASGITLRAYVLASNLTDTSTIGTIEGGQYIVRAYDPTDTTKEAGRSAEFTIKPWQEKPAVDPTATSVNSTSSGLNGVSTTSTASQTGGTLNNAANQNPGSMGASKNATQPGSGTSSAANALRISVWHSTITIVSVFTVLILLWV